MASVNWSRAAMTAAHAGVGTIAASYLYLGGNPFSAEILAPAAAAGVAYEYFSQQKLAAGMKGGVDVSNMGAAMAAGKQAQMMSLGEAIAVGAGVAMLGFGIPAMESVVIGAAAGAGIYGVAYLMPSMA